MRKFTIFLVLLLLGGLQVALAQKIIKGTVTSKEDGSGIPGASVVVVGTTVGAITDVAGNFSFTAPANATKLKVTFLGMKAVEVEIGSTTQFNIVLESDATALDEVVVIGYGTQKKRDLTGAITSVKSADILVSSNPDIGHALIGKAAGLMVRENSAQPGGGLDIFIRGEGSRIASNAPLFVVDGFPITDLQQPQSGNRYDGGTQSILNTFNPNDIASIEVLKDASATSIYGARAAHGVVLITTKRGLEGKPVIQYSTSYAIQKYNNSFDVLPLNEWMQVRNEAAWEQWIWSNNVMPWGTRTLAEAQANPVAGDFYKLYTQNAINNVGRGTDWLALTTRDGAIQQHNISVSGGNSSTRYMISGNYFDQQGVIKNSGFQRYTIRGNLDQDLSKYVKLGVNFSFSRINNENSSLGGDQWENSGIIRASIQQGPHIPAIDEFGNYPLNPQLSQQPNPYSLLTITDNGRIERTMVNSFLDITPVKGLVVRLKAGIDRGLTNRWTYLPTTTLAGELEHGKASISETDQNEYLVEATANYSKEIGEGHSFNILGGVSEEKFVNQSNSSGNTGFITDAFLWNNLASGSGTKTVQSSGSENLMASYFGRMNYIYKEKYYATFTIRTDGASVFGANNKWATFPSLALGWNIANESFFGSLKNTVSQLKLRLSYGQTGNSSIGSNAFATYGAYLAYLSGDDVKNIGVSLNQLASPDLKWETTTEANLGIDYSMFKDRVSGSLELYSRVISDLLDFKQINTYNDINMVAYNIGETQSRGFELTVVTRNVVKNDFQWKTTFSFSKFKDTWKKRPDDWKPSVYESDNDPLRPIFSRVSDGIMQIGEVVPTQPELKPGMIKIKDINGFKRDENGNPVVDENGRFLRTGAPDGMIDEADTKLIGTTDPSLLAGLSNTLTYKNLSLDFFFNGMFGRQLADPNYTAYGVSAEGIYTYGYNGLRTVKDRWTPDNPSTTHPSSYYGWSPYTSGDFFLQKAWFIRLQNISLGYKLPQKWVGRVFQNAQIHFDAQNLFLITPYTGVDPETDSYTAAYPNVKTYTLGLNITFK
ncbi:MAG: TonB-dependent receptor [Lentimicrobiaceae bacterium]|jgi:TonB-linked SusC/RagA family outer membrane protein